ncbi:amino-acid carrier protein AlsT [Salmonella enterica subsp. arizonae]|uniref:Amino-acid carrier protein AlsT n=1 Tax=Salmonella enterica subsp. arizonae TaxID=59203 RepID=A0A379THP2_SALER|nr:amino-acid carrier protein AlsT [Salmonella enterica subsp. arizonae]
MQANSVSRALHFAFNIPPFISGIVLAFCLLLIIIRGIKGVARLMQWLIPIIALLWITSSVFICLWHIEQMPEVIASIVKSAFGWQEAAAGAAGYTLTQAITCGFQRGMFSNEAGMGSTPNAAAAAASYPPHPVAQGIGANDRRI